MSSEKRGARAMIEGLSHITFVVRDLDRMEAVLTQVPGAEKRYDSGPATVSLVPGRFFDIAGVWVAVMEGEPRPGRSYDHVAFKIADADYEDRLARIDALGLEVREGRTRVAGEGRSVYFHDFDGHLFEVHTGTPEARSRRYAEGWGVFMHCTRRSRQALA